MVFLQQGSKGNTSFRPKVLVLFPTEDNGCVHPLLPSALVLDATRNSFQAHFKGKILVFMCFPPPRSRGITPRASPMLGTLPLTPLLFSLRNCLTKSPRAALKLALQLRLASDL